MKPFNLERALAGDPVITGDGRKVQHIFHAYKNTNHDMRVIAVIGDVIFQHFENGKLWSNVEFIGNDLFMSKIKIVIELDIPDSVPIKDISVAADAAAETVQILLGDDAVIDQHLELIL